MTDRPDPTKPMSMFSSKPTLAELAEKHRELFEKMHGDSSPTGLREIGSQLVLLAGYYFRRAEEEEKQEFTPAFTPAFPNQRPPVILKGGSEWRTY